MNDIFECEKQKCNIGIGPYKSTNLEFKDRFNDDYLRNRTKSIFNLFRISC